MTLPNESHNTRETLDANVTPALASVDLDDDWKCDVDGARLEVEGRRTVGDVTYQIRLCSANPKHLKMIPV